MITSRSASKHRRLFFAALAALAAGLVHSLSLSSDSQSGLLLRADSDVAPDTLISEGDRHWAFDGPAPPEPLAVVDARAANPIDSFVFSELRKRGLELSNPADRRALVRRVHLVVLGLPPSPREVNQFVADNDPTAYSRLVERVLSSPRYGERWAQHWLDVIRWAETWGYETNSARPDAWHYRDWVIQSLNQDKGYDRFVFEQIAGDTVGVDAATGFLVAGPANLPGQIGKDIESMRQARQDELDEVIQTVSASILGLSVACARCHHHKFDPLTQRDYYAFQAVFSGLRPGERRRRGPENDHWSALAPKIKRELDAQRLKIEAHRIKHSLAPPLTPGRQVESVDPITLDAARMKIEATSDGNNASLFEFEIWSAEDGGAEAVNHALAANGGRASASSFALENQTRHPDNLIDGLLVEDGRFPWRSKGAGPAWIQIDLLRAATVDKIIWRRGDAGFPVDYEIEVRRPDGAWIKVTDSRRRMIHEEDRRPAGKVKLQHVSDAVVAELVDWVAKARELGARYRRLSDGPQVFAGRFGEPEPTYRLNRGDPMQRLEQVEPDLPAILGSLGLTGEVGDEKRRVAFVRELLSPNNPLTARVMVNRVWQHYYGAGLVDTPSDFGRRGSRPTHPELLDWLAVELIRVDWSLKPIHRLILLSNTFQQASQGRQEAMAIDANSRFLWRFPPRRLEAEAIRDSILKVSGKLNLAMYGSGFDFFNQKGGLSDYLSKESFGPEGWRRMIYATKIRMQSVDIFGVFDCPDAGQMTPKRTRSTTPIQALSLLNGSFVNRQAGFFAQRIREERGERVADQVWRAVELALCRRPTREEAERLIELSERHGLEQVCRILLNTSEFIYLQ